MARIEDKDLASDAAKVDTIGNIWVSLKDRLGGSISKKQREKMVSSTQEYLPIMGKNNDVGVAIRVDRKGNQMIGNFQPEIMENFEGAVINASKWTSTVSGFAYAQATVTGANLTNTASVVSGAYSILKSQRLFLKYPRAPLQFKGRGRISAYANSFIDLGFGVPATVTQIVPTGSCIRIVGGTAYGVITHNGSEIVTPVQLIDSEGNYVSILAANDQYWTWDIILDDDDALFTLHDTQNEIIYTASLNLPLGVRKMWSATALPIYMRVVNSAVPTTSPVLTVGELQAFMLDSNFNRSSGEIAALLSMGGDRQPETGVTAENNTNSVAPVSATLANATAGYTTLGGNFQFVAVAGAETDYCLFGFKVPVGKKLLVSSISIDMFNTVVASATTATIFDWSIASNGSAVTLATANYIKKSLGVLIMPVGTPVGGNIGKLERKFETALLSESERFFAIVLRVPIGTATATEIIRGKVSVDAKFI